MTALCFLALAATTPQSALSTPVTLQFAAAPTRSCIAQLAQAAQVNMSVDEELAWEPIIVKVKDRPLRSVMDSIADALGGVWVEKNNGWILEIDRDLAKAEAAQITSEQRQAIESGLKDAIEAIKTIDWKGPEGKAEIDKEMIKLSKIIEQIKADNPDFSAGGNLTIMSGGSSAASPANALLKQILQTLTAEQLDGIGWDETVVFSNNPTPRQKRLTRSFGPAIADYAAAHNAMAGAAEKAKSGLPQGVNLRSAALESKPIQGGVQKILLHVSRSRNGEGFSINLKIADRAGKIVGNASTYIGKSSFPFILEENQQVEEAPKLPDLGLGSRASELVDINPASRELATVLSQSNGGSNSVYSATAISGGGAPAKLKILGEPVSETALSQEARTLAARPDRIDPLSLASGELTTALADKLEKDLVAVLPDEAAVKAGKILLEGRVAFGRIPSYFDQSGASAEVKDGVLIVEPKSHLEARWNRVNRAALTRLTSDLAGRGFTRLMDVAHYASQGHVRGTLDQAYLRVFTEDWDDVLFGGSDTLRMLRILGHSWSDENLRAQAWDGTTMNAAIRREVEALIYSSPGLIPLGGQGEFVSVMMTSGGGDNAFPEPTLADEPTEKFANGIPASTQVTISPSAGRALFIQNRISGRGTFNSPTEIALKMQNFDGEKAFGPNLKSPDYTFAAAEMTDVHVQLVLPGQSNQPGQPVNSEYFKDGKLDSSAPRVGYGEIPADFAQEIQRLSEQFGQGRIGFQGPGQGRKTPPPSP